MCVYGCCQAEYKQACVHEWVCVRVVLSEGMRVCVYVVCVYAFVPLARLAGLPSACRSAGQLGCLLVVETLLTCLTADS